MSFRSISSFVLVIGASFTGCTGSVESPEPEGNAQEVITTVELSFTPAGGGAASVFTFADPENDGDPVVDDIVLSRGEYNLSVRFLNELESPPEDITDEVAAESDVHQLFFFGSAVDGPATDNANAILTHTYADTDAGDLPVGLLNTVVANSAGTGELSVLLRHLPLENGEVVKVEGLASDFGSGGEAALPGDTDANVSFNLELQ